MHQLAQVGVIFLLIVVFITLLALAIGWKFHHLISTLKKVIKLEVSSVAGRISLVTNFLIALLFLIMFTSHEAMVLVKALIKPDMEAHSLNFNFGFLVVALMFLGNLAVLAFLYPGRNRVPPDE